MLTSLLLMTAISANSAPEAALQIKVSKSEYRVGEQVKYEVSLKNLSPKPIVFAMAEHDGGLAGWYNPQLFKGDVEVTPEISGTMFQGQVMVNRDVLPERFKQVGPNKTISIAAEVIHKIWKLNGPPGLKSSYSGAKTVNLEPGEYTIVARYAFPKNSVLEMVELKELNFTGNSRELFENAFRGELKAFAKFRVKR